MPVFANGWRISPEDQRGLPEESSAPSERYSRKSIVGWISAPWRRKIARRDPLLKSYVQNLIALATAWRMHLYGIAGFLANQGTRRR